MEKKIDISEDIYFKLEFDIQDINVVAGNIYYMIIMTDDISSENNGYIFKRVEKKRSFYE
jgi:hypothetical protein